MQRRWDIQRRWVAARPIGSACQNSVPCHAAEGFWAWLAAAVSPAASYMETQGNLRKTQEVVRKT